MLVQFQRRGPGRPQFDRAGNESDSGMCILYLRGFTRE